MLSCYNRENHKVGVFTNRVRSPVHNGVQDLYCWTLPLSKRTVPEVTWYLTFYSSKLFSWIQSFRRSFCKLTGPGDKCKIEHLASWSLKLWADHSRKVLFIYLFIILSGQICAALLMWPDIVISWHHDEGKWQTVSKVNVMSNKDYY